MTHKNNKMTYDELFILYKKVQEKDPDAIDRLRKEHAKCFPKSYFSRFNFNSRPLFLHTMYLHLTQKYKK